jgi:hypothetical protein
MFLGIKNEKMKKNLEVRVLLSIIPLKTRRIVILQRSIFSELTSPKKLAREKLTLSLDVIPKLNDSSVSSIEKQRTIHAS